MIHHNRELFLLDFIQYSIYPPPNDLCIFSERHCPRPLSGGLHVAVYMEDAAPVPQGEAGRPPADLRGRDEAEADSVRETPGADLSVVPLQHSAAPRQPLLLQVISDTC